MTKIIASNNDNGRTIFKFISKYFTNLPPSLIYKTLRNKDIKVNGKRVSDPRVKINTDDVVEIYLNENVSFDNYNNFKIRIDVVYEDNNILIINKPKNLAVHGQGNSLDDAVKTYLHYNQEDSFAPSHVGRLDKETTGLIMYAKNYKTLVVLNEEVHHIDKIYTFKSEKTYYKKTYVLGMIKDEKQQKMIVSNHPEAQEAKTVLWSEKDKNFAQIITGKKHQIRVLMSHLKDPILGDRKYGGKMRSRLYLHCHILKFNLENLSLKYLNDKRIISNPEWWGKND
ncbi:Pseudouridylate synthase [Mycoplasmopsis californica]|uniref:RNA pseudouridylate synthase n=1 Tax=Mycoplasmopsis equigenitalium TaxID=114883 RepID=A0ABY5J1Y4_9BACT|nr:RluA family pseudouridine synthase [Mycoplasmopsis equigenitalium]UUD37005.1 RluA family pseudouridine synthase [Mycoplasmopsis equigenitalium]VEU69697.1 Pseudouridylate synthase [Mycoplasmopsis californica]